MIRLLLALLLLYAAPALAQDEPAQREVLVMLRLPPAHFRPNAGYGGGDYGDTVARTANRNVAARLAKRRGLELVDGWPMPLLGVDCYVMRLKDGQDVNATIAALSSDPEVRWAQPMQLYRGQAARGDPLYAVQPAAEWRLTELHRLATGRGVRVAVIDSQVELSHPDLAGQVAIDRDFVTGRPAVAERHGTGIAGVIGAKADNGIGIAGVAPGARLVALRACWQSGASAAATLCDTLSLAKALQFAIGQNVPIVNLSLSGPSDRLLDRLIDIALARRMTVVAAYDDALPGGGFPASKPGVIAVADEGDKAEPAAVYRAPGSDVPTTQPNGKWSVVNGNSYAAAHVSGLLALARERRPAEKVQIVTVPRTGNEIDACATLGRTPSACDCACTTAELGGSRGH